MGSAHPAQGSSMRVSRVHVVVTYFYFYIPKLLYLCPDDLFGFEKGFGEREEKIAVLRLVGSFYMIQFSESQHIFLEQLYCD